MDAIDRAVKRQKHISGNTQWESQQWDDFYASTKEKHLFVFGVGSSLTDFVLNNQGIVIESVIDNNKELQSLDVRDVVAGMERAELRCAQILDSGILGGKYPKDQTVVLITSINHYAEIAEQVKATGIENVFIYLCMEVNRRQKDGTLFGHKDLREIYDSYALEYSKKPIVRNKIIFEISAYGETARRVTDCLRRECPDLDIVWVISKYEDRPDSTVRCIYRNNWMNFIREMETAAVWAWETIVPPYIIKRKEQTYIYLKHWSITLKNIGPNIAMADSEWYDRENQVRNAREMDYVFGCSRFDKESFLTSYGIGNVVDVGSPKADVLFDIAQNRKKVRDHYRLNEQVKIVIYAPTFRWKLDGKDNFEVTAERIGIDYDRLRKSVETRFGGEWAVFVRLHPSVAGKSDLLHLPGYVVDASKYRRAEELVSAADIIITDYSSVMFEASYVSKPVFLYATDMKEYTERERDLLIEYDSLPFPAAESDEELEKNILGFDEDIYFSSVRSFMDELGVHEDGHSGERAAEFIKDLIEERTAVR